MTLLAAACLAFLITHLGVSSTPLRDVLKKAIGEGPYLGLYSVMALATFGLMTYAYIQVPHTDFIWSPSRPGSLVPVVLMPFSFILIASGLMNGNPTNTGQADAVNQQLAWIFKVTRHPVQWGILLWALGHLIANGDLASIWFFGTFSVLSSVGMLAMDSKYRKREGEQWTRFFETTSYIPFIALVSGKNSLKFSELGWLNIGIGLVLFVLVYVFHGWIAGVPLM